MSSIARSGNFSGQNAVQMPPAITQIFDRPRLERSTTSEYQYFGKWSAVNS
ncbi:hypothetical protein QUB68_13010 [Microcoleus sp. A006_D1]|uniref:hypothetical protein n=1 Tax=Microcoleus sp. A006_D1 TaxID=3055267 RepID=UPI002FD62F34